MATIKGKNKHVINGKKDKYSFITLVSDMNAFDDKTKVKSVKDDKEREYDGDATYISPRELRIKLKCTKEKKDKVEPDPGTLTITLNAPPDPIKVDVDFVEDATV